MSNTLKNTIAKTYKSNGKLLITGEYLVLDGAMALAIPTKYNQSLNVIPNNLNSIVWKSYDKQGCLWFKDEFKIDDTFVPKSIINRDNNISQRLIQILKAAKQLSPNFFNPNLSCTVTTHLNFNRYWGLGTSSTLINNIANWAKIDAYKLLALTFGGSGYDIACAQNQTPISYQLQKDDLPNVNPVRFNPVFAKHLYFVYLNQKQNSRDGIKTYKSLRKINDSIINTISTITKSIINCKDLLEFEELITTHESITSKLIKCRTIKSQLFNDYNGAIKSLGAWGGDFVLATSKTNPKAYFASKGFKTIIPFNDMILNSLEPLKVAKN